MIEANSAHPVYVYNSFKVLLITLPSVKTLAKFIKSNHSTIVNYIKSGELFRGEWYIRKLPYNITDNPLINNWPSPDFDSLISEIINNAHIKKAIFVYKKLFNKEVCSAIEFIRKFEGITHIQKELNIHHDLIKKHASNNTPYETVAESPHGGKAAKAGECYIFSYKRLPLG